jgi:hypothetical protein
MAKTPGYMMDSVLDILPAPLPIDGRLLSRSRTNRETLVGEVSELRRYEHYRFRKNSSDVGIEVKGKICSAVFEYNRGHYGNDGDLLYWEYNVIPEHRDRTNGISKLIILND